MPILDKLKNLYKRNKEKIKLAIRSIIILLVAIIWILPFIWMVSTSFHSDTDVTLSYLSLIPENPTLISYVRSFSLLKIHLYLINSFMVTFFAVILQTAVCSMAAFAISRLRIPGGALILLAFIATMMVPEEAMMVPLFLLLKDLRLINNYLGMILPLIPWGFSVYMLNEFFKQIPVEIEESAVLDGCSPVRIYTNIILPLAKPALGAVLIFSFIMTWDQLIIPLLVISKQELMTIPLGLANLAQHESGEMHATLAASTMIATLPSIIIFVIFQRYFIRGITSGSLKG